MDCGEYCYYKCNADCLKEKEDSGRRFNWWNLLLLVINMIIVIVTARSYFGSSWWDYLVSFFG